MFQIFHGVKPSANERQKTRNTKQNGLTHHGRRSMGGGAIAPPQYFANQKNEEFKNSDT